MDYSYQDYPSQGRDQGYFSRDDDYYSDSYSRGSSGTRDGSYYESNSYYERPSRGYPMQRDGPGDGGRGRSGVTFVNPEYYDREYGSRFEGTNASAVNSFDDNATKKRKVQNLSLCVDYVRGFCQQGSRCPKPHVDYVESIDEREVIAKVKFCHNFQNRGVCLRPQGCNFLHVTRREEDEFLLTGSIPKTVFERTNDECGPRGDGDGDDDRYRGDSSRGGFSYGRGGSRGRGGRGGVRGGFGRMDRGRGSYGRVEVGGGRGRGGGNRGGGGGNRGGGGHSNSKPLTYSSYCVDFLKGTCSKGQECVLKHVECIDDEEDRAGVVKNVFCHDFLNDRCRRPDCKYVHATRNEEAFFLANGFFSPTINARNREKLFFSNVCLDFLRSQCIRGQKCTFKHVSQVDDVNERKVLSRSIFCHDFQDSDCLRPSCKLLHTSIKDEVYFLHNGCLPPHLSAHSSGSTASNPNLDQFAKDVCRDFIKNRCIYGDGCRFYHPSPSEIEALVANSNASTRQQWDSDARPENDGASSSLANQAKSMSLNEAIPSAATIDPCGPSGDDVASVPSKEPLQVRVNQLERLLADACYCMTLAVGDQNPAISTLMKTISNLAPSSALANDGEGLPTSEEKAKVNPNA